MVYLFRRVYKHKFILVPFDQRDRKLGRVKNGLFSLSWNCWKYIHRDNVQSYAETKDS